MNLGYTYYIDFIISSPTTGSPVDADSLPLVDVFEDDNDTPMYEPEPVKRTGLDGHYRVAIAATTANGFEEGRSYNVSCTAVVGGVTAKAVIKDFILENMKTQTAALLNDPAPDSFEPDMDAYPEPISPPSLNEAFGIPSYPYHEIFLDRYDQPTKTWKPEKTIGDIPADLRSDVLLHQTALDIYDEEYEQWREDYNVQKNVQWRAYLAEKLIEVTT